MMSSLTKTLLTISLIIINRQREHDSIIGRKDFDDIYDYVVIGAGSAGAVVAARLSERPELKILVIEAGAQQTIDSDMPAMTKSLWGSDMDWNFEISPQKHSFQGYIGSSGSFSQGKVIGGSSTINAMAYVRGLKLDFDNWVHNYGLKGWSWDEVMPYFIRIENNSDYQLNHKYHGFNGSLSVQTIQNPDLIHKAFISASEELGYNAIDLNDPNHAIGVAVQQMTISDGSRFSTAQAFLKPVMNRTNIHIMANSLVTKINFNDNRAVSLNIYRLDKHSTIKVRKEIIVSAGAINTAKLLLLSGIGPKEHLTEHQISIVKELPVGHNFHDNPTTFGIHFTVNTTKRSSDILQKDISDYFLKGTGRLTQFEKSVLRLNTSVENNELWPDIQIFADTGSLADFPDSNIASKALNLKPEIWDQFYKQYSNQSTITFIPMVNRPLSRGTVKLRSSRYEDKPLIDPNFYDNPKDIKSMVEAIKIALSLGQTKVFKDNFDAKPFQTKLHDCPSFSSNTLSDDYWECMAKTLSMTFTHPAGTCRMGAENDSKSVISSDLKVYGISGLRIVDASVFPQSPSGALYASVVMIGERGAEFILQDYDKQPRLLNSEPLKSGAVRNILSLFNDFYLIALNFSYYLLK